MSSICARGDKAFEIIEIREVSETKKQLRKQQVYSDKNITLCTVVVTGDYATFRAIEIMSTDIFRSGTDPISLFILSFLLLLLGQLSLKRF